MNKSFFYLVRGTLYRNSSTNPDLVEIDVVFKDENPIIAREKAFDFYQNYVDVFLENTGKESGSHQQNICHLRDFLKSENQSVFKIGDEVLFDVDDDFDKGLFVFLVFDDSKKFQTLEGLTIYEEKLLIHRLTYNPTELYVDLYNNLITEFEIYDFNKYDFKNHKVDNDKPTIYTIEGCKPYLRTPIEFC